MGDAHLEIVTDLPTMKLLRPGAPFLIFEIVVVLSVVSALIFAWIASPHWL